MRNSFNLIFIIIILIILGCKCPNSPQNSNQTQNNQSADSSLPIKQCDLKPDQVPDLKGVRLGMSVSDVKKVYPRFREMNTDAFGGSETYLLNNDYNPNKSMFSVPDGIKVLGLDNLMLELVLLKGRVIKIVAFHIPDNPEGVTLEIYQTRVVETLKLPRNLEQDAESTEYKSLNCDGFKVKAGIQSIKYAEDWLPTRYWFYSIEETDAVKNLEDKKRQAKKNEEEKQKKERENRANNFKP